MNDATKIITMILFIRFPGPHLYAGVGLVCLWALALLMVPQMQKGSDAARTVHIGANISAIGLFLWQVQSGIPILLKVCARCILCALSFSKYFN